MSDDLVADERIDYAQRHMAADEACRAALRAAARLAERLASRPESQAAGVELAAIVLPALAIVGEVHP